jgi:hypothetical protein
MHNELLPSVCSFPHRPSSFWSGDSVGGTPTDAVETAALPKNPLTIEGYAAEPVIFWNLRASGIDY